MDSLLSYLLFRITIKIILIELAIVAICCLIIAITKLITRFLTTRRKRLQETISQSIENALFPLDASQEGRFFLKKKSYGLRNFVEVLESYEQRFRDDRWMELKKNIWEKHLEKDAKAFKNSFSWIKRQLAARAYRLYPEKADNKTLKNFIEDKKNLVKIVGATIIPKTPYKDLLHKMLQIMSQETSLSQFFYRDALVQADSEKFKWMEDFLHHEQNPKIIAILLDVLSTRYTANLFPLIRPFTISEDRACRILAIRAIGSIGTEESVKILMERLSDSDWEVRTESILGLKHQHEARAIPRFSELLNDPIWWVRLQAAKALESFGSIGDQILRSQSKETPNAFEMASYVLSLQHNKKLSNAN